MPENLPKGNSLLGIEGGGHWKENNSQVFRFSIFPRARKGRGVCSSIVSLVNDAIPYYRAKISETFILLKR